MSEPLRAFAQVSIDGAPPRRMDVIGATDVDDEIRTESALVEHVVNLVWNGGNLFFENTPESGPDFEINGSDLTHVRHGVHNLDRSLDGNSLNQAFLGAMGRPLVSTTDGEGVIHYTAVPVHLIDSSNLNSRLRGTRTDGLGFSSVYSGQTKMLHEHITDDKFTPEMVMAIMDDPPSGIYDGEKVVHTLPGLLQLLKRLSCVALSFALRFQRSVFMGMVRGLMGVGEDPNSLPAEIQTWQRYENANKFLWEIAKVVSGRRKVRPTMDVLYTPITDVEILAICDRFEIGGLVLRPGAFEDFLQVTESATGSALVSKDDFHAWRNEVVTVNTFLAFALKRLGRHHKPGNRSVRGFVFKASHLGESSAHVDVCLDYAVERRLLNMSAVNIVATATYEEGDYKSDYRRKIKAEIKTRKVEPDRVYGMVKPLDFSKFVRKPRRDGMYWKTSYTVVKTVGQWSQMCDDLVKCVMYFRDYSKRVSEHGAKWTDSVVQAIMNGVPTFVVVDPSLPDQLGSDERDMRGMIHLYGDLYNKFKESGLENEANLSRFASAMGAERSRRMFTQFVTKSPQFNHGRFDMCCRFDDLASFDLWFKDKRYITRFVCMDEDEIKFTRALIDGHETYNMVINTLACKVHGTDQEAKDLLKRHALDRCKMALSLTAGNVYLDLIGRRFSVSDVMRDVFGTFGSLDEEMIDVYDPNHDEPIVSVFGDGERPDEWVEMDCNSFYYSVMQGTWDKMLHKDLYGFPWIFGAIRRPSFHELTYDPRTDDFLSSYVCDFGEAWIDGINFDMLTDICDGITRVFTWWQFAKTNPNRVERYVHCGAVIDLCSWMTDPAEGVLKFKWWERYGFSQKPSPAMTWIFIQQRVLGISKVNFNLSPSERGSLKRCLAGSNIHSLVETHLSGLWTGLQSCYRASEDLPKRMAMKKLTAFRRDVEKMTEGILTVTKDRKRAKLYVNAAIGRLKHRYTGGGLRRDSVMDVSRMKANGDAWEYKYYDTPTCVTQMMQLHTREVPNTDMILTEMVSVRPSTAVGSPRWFRVDLLTRARIVIDKLQHKSQAFQTKTDCIYFDSKRLHTVLDYLKNKKIPGMNLLDETNQGNTKVLSFSNKKVPPVKYTIHKSARVAEDFAEAAVSSMMLTNSVRAEPKNKDKRLSKDGAQTMLDAYRTAMLNPKVVRTSEILCEAAKQLGVPVPDDIVPYHIEQAKINRRDKLDLYKRYDQLIGKTISDMGSCLIEGPPGVGKSTALKAWIRNRARRPNTYINVVTANHSTIEPYLELDAISNVTVSTFHSYVGTFKDLPVIANNPKEWFDSPECKARSRYYRSLKEASKKYGNMSLVNRVLIIDEYETLPVYAEEILYYLHIECGIKILFVGDRYQTAPIGRGIRPDGSVISRITGGRRIDFDLPFRTLDLNFYKMQREACFEDPLRYLHPVMCEYLTGPAAVEQYDDLCDRIAKEYIDSANKSLRSKRGLLIATSSPDYKRGTVTAVRIVSRILDRFDLSGCESLVYTGFNSYGHLASDTSEHGEQMAEEEAEIHQTDEQIRNATAWYTDACDHSNPSHRNGPKGKSFMVGTRMYFRKGFEFAAIGTIATQYKHNGRRVQIRCGERLFFVYAKTMYYVDPNQKRSRKERMISGMDTVEDKRYIPVRMYQFHRATKTAERITNVWLTEFEVRSKLFWPFGLYQGAVVGHTFEEYAMLNSYETRLRYSGISHYSPLDMRLKTAANLGEYAWTSKLVKQMNVAATRVKEGKKVKVMDIPIANMGYWKQELLHYGQGVHEYHRSHYDQAAYRQILGHMRKSVILSKLALEIDSSQENGDVQTPMRAEIEDALERVGSHIRRRIADGVSE